MRKQIKSKDRVEITKKTYQKIYKDYVNSNKLLSKEIIELLNLFTSLLPGKKVLDVGCAHGRESKYLHGKGLDVTGCDLSEDFIRLAKKNCPKCKFFVCDMRELPKDAVYDGLWVCASFLHIPKSEAKQTLKGFYNVLKKRGILYLSVMEGAFNDFRENKDMGWPKRHFSDYKIKEILNLLRSTGFRLTKSKTVKVHWGPTFLHFFCTKL